LSSFFLNEKLTFFGWLGCGLCIVRVMFRPPPNVFPVSFCPTPARLHNNCSKWLPFKSFYVDAFDTHQSILCRSQGSINRPNRAIQSIIPVPRLPRLHIRPHCGLSDYHFLLCAEVCHTPLHASHSLKRCLLAFALRYGRKSMLWYISVCSMIGGISVSVTTGLGAAIVQTAMGDNQVRSQSIVLVTCLLFYISLNTHSCISCWDL
jgi:Magnesium transporter NIPA